VPTSTGALQIFLILLPGFAAAYLVQLLAIRSKQTDLDKVIEALLFSFVIYVTSYIFHWGGQPFPSLSLPQTGVAKLHPGNVFALAGVTVLWALAMIIFVNRDGTHLLRKWNITERTSRSSIWNDVFQGIQQKKDPDLGSIVQVELADGRSLQGVVAFYSDTADECSVFLGDARWIGDENATVPINGPGILLTRNANIVSISFLDPD
jgi:hypothetical protein